MIEKSGTKNVERREIPPEFTPESHNPESGRVGYFVLYLLGAPIGFLLLLWVVLGDNVCGAG